MAENLVVYTVVHQPRRLRLPARVIPAKTSPEDFDAFLFDEEIDRRYFDKVARDSYTPGTAMFRELTRRGWRLSIGFSKTFLALRGLVARDLGRRGDARLGLRDLR